jgi:hypothetical protein
MNLFLVWLCCAISAQLASTTAVVTERAALRSQMDAVLAQLARAGAVAMGASIGAVLYKLTTV